MHPSLDSAWEKWHRAIEQSQALDEEIAGDEYRIPLWLDTNSDPDHDVFRVEAIPQTPLRWGVLIGEIVYNFRSALDHAVCAAVTLNGRDCERPRSQFPLLSEKRFWPNHRDSISGLTRAQRALVRVYQPYQTWYRKRPFRKPHPLGMLAAMSNADKHRVLNSTFYSPREDDPGFEIVVAEGEGEIEYVYVHDDPLEVNAEAVSVSWTPKDANARLKMEGALRADIALDNGWSVAATLTGIGQLVAAVLREFETFFPQPPHGDRFAEWMSRRWVSAPLARTYRRRRAPWRSRARWLP